MQVSMNMEKDFYELIPFRYLLINIYWQAIIQTEQIMLVLSKKGLFMRK